MLVSLHISDYALIDNIDLDLQPGMSAITGETGAGKSIILGALAVLLGNKPAGKALTAPGKKSVIEATFTIADDEELRLFCAENSIDSEEGNYIIRREILPSGRSKAYINDVTITLSKLQELGLHLIDIHSQHQNQLLSQENYQLHVIDVLADNSELLTDFRKHYAAMCHAVKEFQSTKQQLESIKEDEEFLRFQLSGIRDLNVLPDELEDLQRQRQLLSDSADISRNAEIALDALTEADENAVSDINHALAALDHLESAVTEHEDLRQRLVAAKAEIEDIADTIKVSTEDYAHPARDIEEMDERITEIRSMLHRHKVESSNELIALGEDLDAKLCRLEQGPELLKRLHRKARLLMEEAKAAASKVTESRKKAAADFAARLQDMARPLGMNNLQCDIQVNAAPMSSTGSDKVAFMFAFNKNQELKPIGQTASGGEISRLMLCVKAILASRMQLPAVVFDEIDTGVSGEIAAKMGQMMRDMARSMQVLTITHLPQVASKANHQLQVYKEDDEQATHTRITTLNPEQRIQAIASMLSAGELTKTAIDNAKSLLNND